MPAMQVARIGQAIASCCVPAATTQKRSVG
jgi:hypothetical protein